jgi:RNA polymerase sigma-70 factor (ECF subfamily)
VSDARAIAAETARASYGRLLALLAARTRDIAAAEDALAEAFASALRSWPKSGIPMSPEAWLLTAARRKLTDAGRRASVRSRAADDILLGIAEAEALTKEDRFPDERLKLMFICAHPAIDPAIRTPLMLQTVLGLDAARIASAFLVSPATLGQRLVRAKRKIAGARIPFETPGADELRERLASVLDAIYAAFTSGYDDGGDRGDLTDEALFLADLIARLLPDQPETSGLAALMLYVHARRNARRADGEFVPFDEQDPKRWDMDAISAADAALGRAAALGAPGRYQLEAAIQSAHVAGRLDGVDAGPAVVRLYDRLLTLSPSIGAAVGKAAALLKLGDAEAARAELAAIPADRVAAYQPYWATAAHAHAARSEYDFARAAFDRAIGLSQDAAVRRHLASKKAGLAG